MLFALEATPNEGRGKELVSAKRSSAERLGIHAWHPYYAGYSEAFVRSAVNYLDCNRNTLILDPWGGSGTTGAVASREGVSSLCLDINPIMATFAAAKSHEVLANEVEVEHFFEDLPKHLNEFTSDSKEESLINIFHPDTARLIRSIANSVPVAGHLEIGDADHTGLTVKTAVRDRTQLINPLYAFYMAVIFVSLRSVSGTQTSSNPTWLKTRESKVFVSPDKLFADLRLNAANMLRDLREFYGRGCNYHPNYVLAGDVRRMLLRDRSVDRIITSPPYLTRIDYAMSTMTEMYLFGSEDLLTFVRHQTMGAPVITKNGRHQKEEWGQLCNDVLNTIKNHPTKAAGSYYWKNIVQYFMDTDKALDEIVRVLKPGGKGLIVVQSSYFKEVEIALGQIYCDMASNKGLTSNIAFREEVKGHMAHINAKSNVYKKGKVYFEDFVFIEKPR